jgi:transcriptional regulator with XRE-family HTH domain
MAGTKTSDRIREQISEAMEKRRVTQTSLSAQLGMNKSTLKLKLNGAREFKLSELAEIAEILHLIIVIGV